MTWFGPNGRAAMKYLTTYGYGRYSGYYGAHRTLWSIDYWMARGSSMARFSVLLPISVLLVVSLVVLACAGWRARAAWMLTTRREGAALAGVAGGGDVGLSSPAKRGVGVEVPLLPP